MTFILFNDFLHGRKIITNYYTDFSELLSVQEMVEIILNNDMHNISLGIDEIQLLLNSAGTKGDILKFIMKMVSQTRKRSVDIHFTIQRKMDLLRTFRIQTDVLFEPYKMHVNNDGELELCAYDRCEKEHLIYLQCMQPYIDKPILCFPAALIGNLYDSNEFINEEINLKKVKKKKILKSIEESPESVTIKSIEENYYNKPFKERLNDAWEIIKTGKFKGSELRDYFTHAEIKLILKQYRK